jgi:hypothetical protein
VLPLGVLHAAIPPGEIHTLHQPRLGHLAAHAFFTGGRGHLPATANPEATEIGLRNSLIQRYADFFGEPISDSTHAKIVGETCKHLPRQCVTLFAHWQHEVPDSPIREQLLAEILAQPHFAGATKGQLVDPVARLYGDGPIATDGAADPVQAAIEASELYLAHFHHAAPFSRKALAAAWDRCEADAERGDRCRAARAEVERRLGTIASSAFAP